MKKTLYIKLFFVLALFLGASYPNEIGASQTMTSPYKSIDEELAQRRLNNSVTLDYIEFKVKYGNFGNYYLEQVAK